MQSALCLTWTLIARHERGWSSYFLSMAQFHYETPLGRLDISCPKEGAASLRLHNFEFEGQPLHYFCVEFHQVRRKSWRLGHYIVAMVDEQNYLEDEPLQQRLIAVLRDLFLQWWATEGIAASRVILNEAVEGLGFVIRNESRVLAAHQAELADVEQRLAALPTTDSIPSVAADAVGALLARVPCPPG